MRPESVGPVEFLAFSFPLGVDGAELGKALHDVVESAHLDVVDLVVGERRGANKAEFFEFAEAGSDLGFGELGSLRSLIAVEDLDAVASAIEPDRRVVVLVVEHAWHREANARVATLGGRLEVDQWVDPADYLAALAAGDQLEQEA